MFAGFLRIAPSCDACGFDYSVADIGDGAAVFVMFVAGFVVVLPALFVEVAYQPPVWVHALLWLPLTLVVCLALLRPFKGMLFALQVKHKAEEARFEDRI
ncbi:DUF983 domain-containing protein [Hyphobacterium marinum]|uniref:DUF983 domain-containing protein n=1 Tax=Hyphobacterium marinum TaxID=3116574 RepID=A0ABU7LXJ7_9PROT|nr:DUF983 domain-containing protein [Hyphobacterium sp. Y6023]MEE2566012.1 DUF983 domain-containing protein [Hyphobacterium sp. Y6023]